MLSDITNRLILVSVTFSLLCLAANTSQSEDKDLSPALAKRGRLIFVDDGSIHRGGKKAYRLNETTTVRAWVGKWEKKNNVWRSTWSKGMGHTPVVSYDGEYPKNLIVEVIFRYGPLVKNDQMQCFRITLDNRNLYTGHILSAWANQNNDFIEKGLLLQHIHKNKDKTIVEDTLLDHQPLEIEPQKWNTALLEVVGNETLFRMNDHVAYAKFKKLDVEKKKVALTLGSTWHEVKSVRVWEAKSNPAWEMLKPTILSKRSKFISKPHTYSKSKKVRTK